MAEPLFFTKAEQTDLSTGARLMSLEVDVVDKQFGQTRARVRVPVNETLPINLHRGAGMREVVSPPPRRSASTNRSTTTRLQFKQQLSPSTLGGSSAFGW